MSEDWETAEAFRVIARDGSDITDRCTIVKGLPDLRIEADSATALDVARVEFKSGRSGLWPSVNVGSSEVAHLARGNFLDFDGRIIHRS